METNNILCGLQDILRQIQSSSENHYSVYFIKRTVTQKTPAYSIIKATREHEIIKNIKIDAAAYTNKLLERDKLTSYMNTLEMQRGELQYISLTEVPHITDIISECVSYQSSSLDLITSFEDFATDLWGYIIKIASESNSIFMFKKYTRSELLDVSKRKYWNDRTRIISIPDHDILEMDKKYDAIVSLPLSHGVDIRHSFEINPFIYISRRSNFEDFFSYKEYYPRFISENIQSFGDAQIIDNYEELGTRCQSSFNKAIRFARILHKKRYDQMTSTKIKKYIKKHDLPVEIKNKVIVYNKKHIEAILEILEECYYTAEISGAERKATNSEDV